MTRGSAATLIGPPDRNQPTTSNPGAEPPVAVTPYLAFDT